ncbi:DUF445 domain-containing protein [Acinetobacter qingfengensis]|uniref:Uncharacterized protein n=1 Tax=Acinetobacter qingfengensis TaxID=1262585 RepID=A0A1E7R4Y5_9GAMM|nr:DUF445 domain-containing protein [Acinetobacter qingfengensis]KAA8732389.1 DUF445 domain-containing protein [Acinetobacter qingfengensis]OEY94384.1 hypothetical protein BJI46_03315 [Acinetobacter qingfengensis]
MSTDTEISSLQHSKRLAGIALAIAAGCWIALMVLAKIFPQYSWLIHILMLSAEAGVVGGLADWYAITVLFRNPFGKFPLPKLLRDHTEIIPRNKARIAESMGRFVQENFLSPTVVQNTLAKTDISLAAGNWLRQPENSQKIVEVIQFGVPKFFEFFGQQQISQFIQDNSVQWVKNTRINRLASEMLRAILDNDFHQDVLQRGLDAAHHWLQTHPHETEQLTKRLFEEMGVAKLAKGVSFLGIDVQQRSIKAFIKKIEQMLADPDHPWRQHIEDYGRELMHDLMHDGSKASLRLNQTKDAFLESPQLLNFISSAVTILCQAITKDLQRNDSGLATNLRAVIMQVGESIRDNIEVREVFNQRFSGIATQLSAQYSDKVIRFISQQIHAWDSREMIAKIENEVGGDLHMIRVNGVVVGGFIGLLLGIFRAGFDYLF